jgi:hypothetical protein
MLSDVTPATDIAIMGAILLATLGVTPERGIEMTAAHAALPA